MSWFNFFTKDIKQAYATKLLKRAMEDADTIRKTNNEINDVQWFSILLEFVYLYLHMTDRIASELLNNEQRGLLNKWLAEVVIDSVVYAVCKDWESNRINGIKQDCWKNFYTAMEEYSRYKKLFPEKDEGTKDTLFWEFSKLIANYAGCKDNIGFFFDCQFIVIDSLKYIDIKSFVKNVKNDFPLINKNTS